MASIRRKSNSPYYFACIRLPNGKRTQVTTRLTDRKAAQKWANEIEDESQAGLSQTRARKLVSRLSEISGGSAIVQKSTADFLNQWVARKQVENAQTTAVKYKSVCDAFIKFLGKRADADLSHVTIDDIRNFRDASSRQNTPQTANGKLKVLRVAFQDAWREQLITENPAQKTAILKIRFKSQRKVFDLEQLIKLHALADEEWKGIILFGLYTGQRLMDLCLIRRENIDSSTQTWNFVAGKTGRRASIPLALPIIRWLANQGDGEASSPIFPKAHKLVTATGRVAQLSEQFYRLKVSAELAKPRTHKRTGQGRSAKRASSELPFHSLRHTTTTLLKKAGIPTAIVMDIIGHETKAISENYTHIDVQTKLVALQKLPEIG